MAQKFTLYINRKKEGGKKRKKEEGEKKKRVVLLESRAHPIGRWGEPWRVALVFLR